MKQGTRKINSEQLLKRVALDITIPSFERFQHMMVTKPEVVRYTHQRSRVCSWLRPVRSWTASLVIPVALVALAVMVILPSSHDMLSGEVEVLTDETQQELYMLSQEDAYADTVVNAYMNQFLKVGESDYQ